jgi:hypothetical protein
MTVATLAGQQRVRIQYDSPAHLPLAEKPPELAIELLKHINLETYVKYHEGKKPLRILILDDNLEYANRLAKLLRHVYRNVTVDVTDDAQKAKELLVQAAKSKSDHAESGAGDRLMSLAKNPVNVFISDVFFKGSPKSGLEIATEIPGFFKSEGIEQFSPGMIFNTASMLAGHMWDVEDKLGAMAGGLPVALEMSKLDDACNEHEALGMPTEKPAIVTNRKYGVDPLQALAKIVAKINLVQERMERGGRSAIDAQMLFLQRYRPEGMPEEISQIMAHTVAERVQELGATVHECLGELVNGGGKILDLGWYQNRRKEFENGLRACKEITYKSLYDRDPTLTSDNIHTALNQTLCLLPPAKSEYGPVSPWEEDAMDKWRQAAKSYNDIDAEFRLFRDNLTKDIDVAGLLRKNAQKARFEESNWEGFVLPPMSQTDIELLGRVARFFEGRNKDSGYDVTLGSADGACTITFHDDKGEGDLLAHDKVAVDMLGALKSLESRGNSWSSEGDAGTSVTITLRNATAAKRDDLQDAVEPATSTGHESKFDWQGKGYTVVSGLGENRNVTVIGLQEAKELGTELKGMIVHAPGGAQNEWVVAFAQRHGHSTATRMALDYLKERQIKVESDPMMGLPATIEGVNSFYQSLGLQRGDNVVEVTPTRFGFDVTQESGKKTSMRISRHAPEGRGLCIEDPDHRFPLEFDIRFADECITVNQATYEFRNTSGIRLDLSRGAIDVETKRDGPQFAAVQLVIDAFAQGLKVNYMGDQDFTMAER